MKRTLPFHTGQYVTLKGDTGRGRVSSVIDATADVPYYWVYWLDEGKTRGHRSTELAMA